jgi:hypothetical protein
MHYIYTCCCLSVYNSIVFYADIPFVKLEDAYRLVLCHLKGLKVDILREESAAFFSTVKKGAEDNVEEYLNAWAQCNIIPMFKYRNKKAFSACNYRPDFLWMLPDLTVMLECDEHAHDSYNRDSEVQRMHTLNDMALQEGFARVVFVRFNPSLKGLSQAFKFTTLQIVLSRLFSGKEYKTDVHQSSAVYLFYPDAPQVWCPVNGLLPPNKRPRSDTPSEVIHCSTPRI